MPDEGRRTDGSMPDDGWREGHRILIERAALAPDAVRVVLESPPPCLRHDPARVRRFVATGVGSSAAHARLLVALLSDLGLAARFLPLTAFASAPAADADAHADALFVFSQGLSPNARLPLRHAAAWRQVTLVTAVPERPVAGGDAPGARGQDATAATAATPAGPLADRQAALRELAERGVDVLRYPAPEEYGTLLRVTGPLAGAAATIRLALAIAAATGRPAAGLVPDAIPVDAVCARVAGARDRLAREHPDLGADVLEAGTALLASGGYGELLSNLAAKLVEGLLLPAPAVWDLLDFAHGPFQQSRGRRAAFLALTRPAAPHGAAEAELLDRLATLLDPDLHRLVRLPSELPGALALLEHEALLDALVLRGIAERGIDQARFPGRGADGALYGVASLAGAARGEAGADAPPGAPSPVPPLAALGWCDVDRLLAAGVRTALLPLGSTEQHGPHLPLATDTLIADAVAERFCARVPGVVRLPAVPFGCAREHLGFPGTVSLAEATLAALLRDVASSLAAHGFERLLVFTAHGGNYGVLRDAAASLADDATGLRVDAFTDFARLTDALVAASARFGVSADASGQHAGELETSLVAALAPALVKHERLASGLVGTTLDPDALFYPDLRRHAPDGTVGDPRDADAARAEAYLDAWVDVLTTAFSHARKANHTKGTKNE